MKSWGGDKDKFCSFMRSFNKDLKKEDQVFAQELSSEDLVAATGGARTGCWSGNETTCLVQQTRQMYYDRYNPSAKFPNCAKTAEKDSWCTQSDACIYGAILYLGLNQCQVSWE